MLEQRIRELKAIIAENDGRNAADSRFAESARSGDLGYTWGGYSIGPAKKPTEQGFYVRVWQRERNGQWAVVMDALRPSAG